MPLAQQRKLKYEENVDGKIREFTVTYRYIGGKKTKIFGAHYDGKKPVYNEFREQDSLIFFVTESPLTKFQPESLTEYAEAWINENAHPGDVWENDDTGTQTVLAGFETISVPAGSFANCYKTTTEALPALFDTLDLRLKREEISDDEYEKSKINARMLVVRWFAPKIGLVKEQIGSENHTIELVAVEEEGIGEIDTTKSDGTFELFFQKPYSQDNH